MFWGQKRTTKKMAKSSRSRQRRLRLESLESRRLLAGDVTVDLTGGTLTLTGDGSGNKVSLEPGSNPGEYKIIGDDTEVIGDCDITDPFDTLVIDLGGGSDTFKIIGNSYSNKLLINGSIQIDNGQGSNVNELTNVHVVGSLTVTKVDGVSESKLVVDGSTIVGDAIIDNAFNGSGDSITKIHGGSIFQGDLSVTNADGEDILYIYGEFGAGADAQHTTVDGDITVNNGNGDTRTSFGLSPGDSAPTDPDVYGSISITNADGYDEVVIFETNVWGTVEIDNGDGHSDTVVQTSHFGLGIDLGQDPVLSINNGAGRDVFSMMDSSVKDDLVIDNAVNNSDTYGSQVVINSGSRIGNDFVLESDAGYDTITIDASRIIDELFLTLFDGSSEVTLNNSEVGEQFQLTADIGRDAVRISNTEIGGDTDISLGGGVDRIDILGTSHLRGQTSLMGGDNVDTFFRELSTGIEIDFLFTEDLEVDLFG